MSRWDDVGRALLGEPPPEPAQPGIAGTIGDALFACALGGTSPDERRAWIQRAIDDLVAHGGVVSLHDGFAGLGLVIATFAPDEAALLDDLDDAIADNLGDRPAGSLQSGAAGVALYASLRRGTPSGDRLRRAVVDRLRGAAVRRDGGVAWLTPAAYARSRGVEVPREPVLELGMVHGMAGALVGLAALAASGDADAAELARAGLAAAWANTGDDANRFGRIVFGEGGSLGARAMDLPRRWCVGDPGVLRALFLTARAVDDATSAQRALAALRDDAARDARSDRDELAGRIDLCCGAAAVAQVYLRMHRETGEPIFRDANRALLARCAAGFDRVAEPSFAYGRRGIVLALLAGERDARDPLPPWDAILGTSLPVVGA